MRKATAVLTSLILFMTASMTFSQLPEIYHTYQEVEDTLSALHSLYPEIMHVDTMGYSTRDNIPMLRVKLSDNPLVNEDEPAVFYCGGVHADEVLGVEVVMNFLYDFTEKYAQGDTDIMTYLAELELFIVPFINPEGHLVVESGDLDWRKNKSDNDTNGVFDFHDGVDNNRNYDFGWNIDNEPDAIVPESLQFKGWAPFTEAENIAMAEMGWTYRPIIALDHHSPTYGRPNVAYYPWYWYGSEGGHGYGPDEQLMQSICASYTNQILAIPDDSGTVHYTARRALVNKGDFKTYFYGNFGTAAFSVEISDTTIQAVSLVDSIVAAHEPGLYWLLDRSLFGRITGVIRDSVTLEPIEAEVQVIQHINEDINPRLSRPDYGRYNRLLAPGSYDLRILKTGYRTKNINNVQVSTSGPTETNVLLYPYNPRPPAPELTYPADQDTLDINLFTFTWTEPAFVDGYLLEIAQEDDFDQVILYDSSLAANQYELTTPLINGHYYWRVRPYNDNGWGPNSAVSGFAIDYVSDVDDDIRGILPGSFMVYQNYPNPFNSTTRIKFNLDRETDYSVEIFDLAGRLVERTDGHGLAGLNFIDWNLSGRNQVSSGVYFYRVTAGDHSGAGKMTYLK